MKHPRNSALAVIVFLSLLLMTALYWFGYKSPTVGIDDANIYMVYMKNLANGYGFVWNTGGERVEGFTSLLWTLIGAALYKVSAAHVTTLLLILCFALSYITLYRILVFARRLNHTEDRVVTASDVIILSLLLLPRGFVEWNVLSLMETTIWMFFITSLGLQLGNYYLLGKKISIPLFSALLILMNLTRPESIALNLFFIILLFGIFYFERGLKYSLAKIIVPLVAYGVSLGGLLGWRLSYFGYPFPNTYYAKVSANKKDNIIAGCRYVIKFFYFYPHAAFITAILLFFAIAILLKKRDKTVSVMSAPEKIQLVFTGIVFCGLVLPVLTGGDNFMFSRFYQPLLPILYLCAVNFFLWKQYAGITAHVRKTALVALAASFIFATAFFSKLTVSDFFMNDSGLMFPEFIAATNGRKTAMQLNETFADCGKPPSIGAIATGGVGYSYGGKTIDLLGLNNTLMAHASSVKTGYRNHASFDKKAFWQLRPDLLGTAFGGEIIRDTASFILYENLPQFRPGNFIYQCMKQIHDDDDFRAQYIPALLKHRGQDYFVFGYYARPFLDSLNPALYQVRVLERKFNPHASTTKR